MIVAITGKMRSGTSAVAEALHMAGVPVAVQIGAPIPPAWRSDWEDVEFSRRLMFPRRYPLSAEAVRQHLRLRRMHAVRVFDTDTFAIKSPFLALHADQLEAEAGDRVRWVVTERDEDEVGSSLRLHPILDPADNERIGTALAKLPDPLWVPYARLVEAPRFVLSDLLRELGLRVSAERLEAAAESVKQPTVEV